MCWTWHPRACGQESTLAALVWEPREGQSLEAVHYLICLPRISFRTQNKAQREESDMDGPCPRGTAILVVKERWTNAMREYKYRKRGRSSVTCLVSKLTKQYPRGCPSKAPDLWKRKSNCFTVPNFWRSFRRWYLWTRNSPWAGNLLASQPDFSKIKAGDNLPQG